MVIKYIIKLSVVFWCILTTSSDVFAWTEINKDIHINCSQAKVKTTISCDYRLLKSNSLTSIEAKIADHNIPIISTEDYPWSGAKTAILFLIDTSDPARQDVVNKNIHHLKQLLDVNQSTNLLGLASFDKNIRIEAPIGSNKEQILNASLNLKAIGKTTELYRNLIEAIELVGNSHATRKAVFIFSDGLAEDKAYFHQDVISAARKHGVIVKSLGYPRSTSLSVALQRLRRISEETGGQFVEANNNFDLPASFLSNPYQDIVTGGRFVLNLDILNKDTTEAAIDNSTNIAIKFKNETTDIIINLPIERPKEIYPASEIMEVTKVQTEVVSPPVSQERQKTPEVRIVNAPKAGKPYEKWLLYGIPLTLLILLLLTVALIIITVVKPREKKLPHIQMGDLKPYAYLVLQDETKRRFPITRTTWRIGRSKDNELPLQDNSISRRHAEIHRNQGDDFTIIDLDSLNGVFVNNEKVKIQQLSEGDIIEIGDINFRFTLLGSDYSLEEETVIQKTKSPVTH